MKYVVVIQCELALSRCSGYACMSAYYEKKHKFKDDTSDRYLSISCGGCCGKGLSAKAEHFAKKIRQREKFSLDQVVVHLSSCMVYDNYHTSRCPHVEEIKEILNKKGFLNIVEGTYISRKADQKRKLGVYKTF